MNGKSRGKQQQTRSLIGQSVQEAGGESRSGSAVGFFFLPPPFPVVLLVFPQALTHFAASLPMSACSESKC